MPSPRLAMPPVSTPPLDYAALKQVNNIDEGQNALHRPDDPDATKSLTGAPAQSKSKNPGQAHEEQRGPKGHAGALRRLPSEGQPFNPAMSAHRGRKRRRLNRRSKALSLSSHAQKDPFTAEGTRAALLEQYLNREHFFNVGIVEAERWRSALIQANCENSDSFLTRHGMFLFKSDSAWTTPSNEYQLFAAEAEAPLQLSITLPPSTGRLGTQQGPWAPASKRDQLTQAEQIDELVPIRLDIEWDEIRLRDTFTWNLHDRLISVGAFARQLVEDFKLDLPSAQSEHLTKQIQASVEEQIVDFHPHVYIAEDPLDPHLPYSAYKNDEMRIVIKLNITIGQHTLVDQFEWDINNSFNSPEEFASQMTRELSLSGEFTTAIAHSIREQSQLFTHSLYVVGHPFDGRPIEDHELLGSFQPSPLPSAFRPYQAAKEFTPCLYELNEAELEKTELSLSREERRQKRSVNRRGGPALPDLKDRRRTIRTLLVSSVLPGAVGSVHESRIYKRAATTGKARKGANRDGFDEFDDSDSDDSGLGSPAASAHLYPGTSRTRGVRGAASAAQAAMRANFGRSATPESIALHHHETRASGRKVIRDDSTPEPQPSHLVVLRLPRAALQRLHDLHSKQIRSAQTDTNTPPRHGVYSKHAFSGTIAPPPLTPQSQPPINPASLPSNFRSQAAMSIMPSAPRHGSSSYFGRHAANALPGRDPPPLRPGNGDAYFG